MIHWSTAIIFSCAVASSVAAESRHSVSSPAPSPSPKPRRFHLPDDYPLTAAKAHIRALHPTKEQEDQLILMALDGHRFVGETHRTKSRAPTEEEWKKMFGDARKKAKAFLSPKQYEQYCEDEFSILIFEGFPFVPE